MTTTARPARRPPSPDGLPAAGRGVHTGPIRRIVVGSLATGLAGAAVLTVVVVSGASEPVVTGSALLGFAAGWAVLAVLSTRMTDQPQRWAFVPAAGMAATGTGLLVLAPGDGALTAAGWIWPPLLLVLAVWMGVHVRRSLAADSGRWLLYPVVAVTAIAAVGGAVETVGLASDQRSYAMPGRLYDVGGHRLHLDCTGSGSPTVVLVNGLGEYSASWARTRPDVAGTREMPTGTTGPPSPARHFVCRWPGGQARSRPRRSRYTPSRTAPDRTDRPEGHERSDVRLPVLLVLDADSGNSRPPTPRSAGRRSTGRPGAG